MGDVSIQRAAAQILEKYYVDFPIYNPYLDMLPGTRGKKGFKVYDVDGVGNGAINVSIENKLFLHLSFNFCLYHLCSMSHCFIMGHIDTQYDAMR